MDQTTTEASAFKIVKVSDLHTVQLEKKRRVLPAAAIRFKMIAEDKSSSGYTELLAFTGDDSVGYALLEARPKGELYIELVLTYPPYRQQGVGPALVREIERYGRSKAFRRLTGEVFANDYTSSSAEIDRRAHWFEAQGFKIREMAKQKWRLAKVL